MLPALYRSRLLTIGYRLFAEGVVGCHGLAPGSVRVRAGASLSKFATHSLQPRANEDAPLTRPLAIGYRLSAIGYSPKAKLEPLVGLAPTNTSLRNSPCSC